MSATPLSVPPSANLPNAASIDATAMLLLLQAGIGLVSLIGTVIFAIFMGAPVLFAGPLAVGAIGVILPLLFTRGILRVRRKARTGVIVYEAVIVLGFAAKVFIGREYAVGLIPLLTGIVLPATILGIVLNRSCRLAFAKQKRQKRRKTTLVGLDATPVSYEQAA